MTRKRFRTLSLEILNFCINYIHVLCQTFSKLNKSSNRPVCNQQNLNLKAVRANQVEFGEKSLRILGPKI